MVWWPYLRQISLRGKPASPAMTEPQCVTAPILLIGHGSTRCPQARDILRGHAAALCRRGYPVVPALVNGAPRVQDAPCGREGPWHRAVPFFMQDGYFTRTATPRALRRSDIRITAPIGLHPMLPRLIHRRAEAGCRDHGLDPAETAVLLVGHGSASAPGRPLAPHRHTAQVGSWGRFAAVTSACLEEPPFLPDALRALGPRPVLVIGYFANRGGHVLDDVPRLVRVMRADDSAGWTVHEWGNITEDPAVADIVLDQAGPWQGG
jgi:sirohydrochlorin cobaltochelatase